VLHLCSPCGENVRAPCSGDRGTANLLKINGLGAECIVLRPSPTDSGQPQISARHNGSQAQKASWP